MFVDVCLLRSRSLSQTGCFKCNPYTYPQ